jgi:hypothetical protein
LSSRGETLSPCKLLQTNDLRQENEHQKDDTNREQGKEHNPETVNGSITIALCHTSASASRCTRFELSEYNRICQTTHLT